MRNMGTWLLGKVSCAFSWQPRKLNVSIKVQLTVQVATLNFTMSFLHSVVFALRHHDLQCSVSTVIGQNSSLSNLHRYDVSGLTNEPTGTALN